MGSSPSFSMDIKVPDIRTERMVLPIINEESFGFAQEIDSIEIVYQYYGVQNEYIENQTLLYQNEIERLDSILLNEISGTEGNVGEGPRTRDYEERILTIKDELSKLDSMYVKNIMKMDTYEFKENKISIHFHCSKCAPFDPSKDAIEIRKEKEDLFLVINEDFEYRIEKGIHDLEAD